MFNEARICLASASPRRLALLEQLGLRVSVEPVDLDEQACPGEEPSAYVQRLAREKAQLRLQSGSTGLPVLGADTIVCLDGQVLGKPADQNMAEQYLTRLSGRKHEVLTAVAVVNHDQLLSCLNRTAVWFCELDAASVRRYVASGEPSDKAGAYAIQGMGGAFVERIEGSYSAVVGLPLADTSRLLRQFDIPVP